VVQLVCGYFVDIDREIENDTAPFAFEMSVWFDLEVIPGLIVFDRDDPDQPRIR
jgi:hypothetical protein